MAVLVRVESEDGLSAEERLVDVREASGALVGLARPSFVALSRRTVRCHWTTAMYPPKTRMLTDEEACSLAISEAREELAQILAATATDR